MGDDDEAGVGAVAHLVQHPTEAIDIGVVQRGVDLVQHADRCRVGQEDGKDQRRRRQRLFAARHQAHHRQPLARRAGENFQPGLQRIIALDQLQFGLSAVEQGLEQGLEIIVDDVEGGDQPFAALGVQLVDTVAQFGDGSSQVGPLHPHAVQPFPVFVGLFLGQQVDGPQGVPLPLQPEQQTLGPGGVRRAGNGVVGQFTAQVLG